MDAVAIYTDNNAVRDSMISCHTANDVAKKILVALLNVSSSLHHGTQEFQRTLTWLMAHRG